MTDPTLQLDMGDEFKPQPFVFEQHPTPGPFYRFSIPWQYCISDNERMIPIIMPGGNGRKPRPQMVLSGEYKKAKARVKIALENRWGDQPLLTGDLFFFAYIISPNRSRRRDGTNFAKMLCDAFEGTVFENDHQIADSRWRRAGVNPDRPRIEIVLGVIPDKRLAV